MTATPPVPPTPAELVNRTAQALTGLTEGVAAAMTATGRRLAELIPTGFPRLGGPEPADVALPEHIRYIESPTEYVPIPGERAVSLGGGIPGVELWQGRAVELFRDYLRPLAIICPRRRNFPYGDPAAGRDQVEWEHRNMRPANGVCLFYLPACLAVITVQPSTLVELGWVLGSGSRFVIGADPGYPRRDIVEFQTAAAGHFVLSTLADTVGAAMDELDLSSPAP